MYASVGGIQPAMRVPLTPPSLARAPGTRRRRTSEQSPHVLRSAPTSGASSRVVDQEEARHSRVRVPPPVAGARGKEEPLALADRERLGAVVELVLDTACDHVAAVAVRAPLVAGGPGPILDDRPARSERLGRTRPDVLLVVRPVDGVEAQLAPRAHGEILTDSASRRSTSATSVPPARTCGSASSSSANGIVVAIPSTRKDRKAAAVRSS